MKIYKAIFIVITGILLYPLTSSAQLLPENIHSATEQFGVDWSLAYTAEVFSNLAGGLQAKTAYQGYLDLGLDIDLEKIFGLDHTSVHLNIIHLHGKSPSAFVGDELSVSNIDGVKTTRLQQLYLQYQPSNNKWGIKAGLLAVDEDYLSTDGSDHFLHGAAATYWSTLSPNAPAWPVASTAVQVHYNLSDNWTLRLGVFDADADNLDEAGANFHGFRFTLQANNLFLITEASWNGSISGNNGVYRFGSWHDTNRFSTSESSLRHGLSSIYLTADQQLYAKNSRRADGFYLFTLAGWVFQQNSAPIDYDIHAGAYWKGLITDWDDTLGIFFTYPHEGDRTVISNIITTESFLELTYKTKITDGWPLQGSLQYIKNPGGLSGVQLQDATVLGLWTVFLPTVAPTE